MRKGKTKEEILLFLKGFIDVVNKVEKTSLKSELKNYIKQSGFNKKFIALLDDTFFIESITTNLEETLKQISLRTLYLTGTKNKIINYHDETTLIASFKNQEIEIEIFEGLNHYLTDRNGKVGSSLYNMDKQPLTLLINWITKQ
jgi:esterase/lipase